MKKILIFTFTFYLILHGASLRDDRVFEKNGIVYEKSKNTVFTGEVTSYYKNKKVKSIANYISGLLDGVKSTYQEDGSIIEMKNYKNGKLDGEVIYYSLNKNPFKEELYSEGKLIGETSYRLDGQIEKSYYYKDGSLFEEKRNYDFGDRLTSIGRYKDGKMHGNYDYYYKNGNLEKRETYNHSATIGPYVEYYEDGSIKAKGTSYYQHFSGEYVRYFSDGSIESIDKYGQYGRNLVGNSCWYWSNGLLRRTINFSMYDNVERYRIDTDYGANGKKVEEMIYFITNNESQMEETINGKEEIVSYKNFYGIRISKLAYTLNNLFNTTKFIILDKLLIFNFIFFILLIVVIFFNQKKIMGKVLYSDGNCLDHDVYLKVFQNKIFENIYSESYEKVIIKDYDDNTETIMHINGVVKRRFCEEIYEILRETVFYKLNKIMKKPEYFKFKEEKSILEKLKNENVSEAILEVKIINETILKRIIKKVILQVFAGLSLIYVAIIISSYTLFSDLKYILISFFLVMIGIVLMVIGRKTLREYKKSKNFEVDLNNIYLQKMSKDKFISFFDDKVLNKNSKLFNGEIFEYFSDNQGYHKKYYSNGTLNGEQTAYYEREKIKITAEYRDGFMQDLIGIDCGSNDLLYQITNDENTAYVHTGKFDYTIEEVKEYILTNNNVDDFLEISEKRTKFLLLIEKIKSKLSIQDVNYQKFLNFMSNSEKFFLNNFPVGMVITVTSIIIIAVSFYFKLEYYIPLPRYTGWI